MPTQAQFKATTKSYRNIDIKISVLDYNFYLIDEISGLVESASFNIDADSDIRRTCDITMQLEDKYNVTDKKYLEYWKAGNPYWFDKYLKIEIGIKDGLDYVWHNQGIYLLNEPSVTYDAETNELQFQAVDLMARLTGLRNGNLEGIEYYIPVNSNIKEVVASTIADFGFNKYVIIEPPQAITPYEIRISAGGTAYDLLTELRDINPDWEMFFDVEGVFYFQQILSNENMGTQDSPFVTIPTWDKLSQGYQLTTSFEDVKNYIEVYGQTKQANATATATYMAISEIDADCTITLDYNISDMVVGKIYDTVFTLGNINETPTVLPTPVNTIYIVGYPFGHIDLSSTETIKYNNYSYVIRLIKDDNNNLDMQYLGYVQAFGYAFEDNINSPFYVGELIDGEIPYVPAPLGGKIRYLNASDGWKDMPKFRNSIRIVCSSGEYDNIYSNKLAVERAKYELYLHCRRHDTIAIKCVPIYWLDVNTLIEYKLSNEDVPSYWIVKSVSTDFSVDGVQDVTAIRYYPNYS